jgi:hypothetical protein
LSHSFILTFYHSFILSFYHSFILSFYHSIPDPMKKHAFTLLLLLLGASTAMQAQFTLSGSVVDSSRQALANATLALLQASDSVLLSFALSDAEGKFTLKRVAAGEYLLQVSYLGFQTNTQRVEVRGDLKLPPIEMRSKAVSMEEVKIEGERTPIFIKKDTIEYNADAFRTQPGDNVEQLLKRLPGVEVDKDGNVKAMGEDVQKVLVDGKEFFGNDPKMATKNLPAEVVDRVQVFDQKSDLAEFTGVDDGQRQKTINLNLKEDKKKGAFGNVMGGYGQTNWEQGLSNPEHLYTSKLNVNRFTAKSQLSVIGMLNNVNQQGFSINEYINFMGGMQSLMSGGGGGIRLRLNAGAAGIPLNTGGTLNNGFVETGAGGLNFNADLGKKTELSTSYFFNHIANTLDQQTTREQFLNQDLFRTEEQSEQLTDNQNHRLNLRLRHEIDSMSNLLFRANASYNQSELLQLSESATRDLEGVTENASLRDNSSVGNNLNATGSLSYRRRFQKKGRSLVATLDGSFQENEQSASLFSINSFRPDAPRSFADTIEQEHGQTNDQLNWGGKLSYTEPLGNRKYLQFNLEHKYFQNDWNREVYDLQPQQEPKRVLNTQLSNAYDRRYQYERGGMSLLVNGKKSSLTASMDLQRSLLDGELITLDTSIRQSFVNILPRLRYRYDFATTRNLSVDYRTNVQEPSLEQLSPIIDNTDPLNVYIGNPELRPEYNHNLNLRFMSFSQFSFTNFFAVLRARYTSNRITNAKWVDSLFRQITQPVNVDNDLNLSLFSNFGTPLRFIKSTLRLQANSNYSRSILFVNNIENRVNRLSGTFGISLENRKKDKVDAIIGAKFSPTQTRYSVSVEQNQDFVNQNYYADLTLNLGKNWMIKTSFDYTLYGGEVFGEDQSIALWEASITRYLLKNRRGQLTLTGFDLLNQNQGINRSSTFNYVEETQVRTLSRYVLLSFTYNLSKFGAQQGGGQGFRVMGRRR